MVWSILGIRETRDRKAITRAYRERLSAVNPEDKPEEFKELRAAYEEALKLAEREEQPQEQKTDLELWTDELEVIYNNLPKRLDPAAWKALLSRDICLALDTREQAGEALLVFIMDHYRIPHRVLLLLNEQFDFSGRMEELKEKFPEDFLRFIDYSLRHGEGLPLALFTPGLDGEAADHYADLYRKASQTPPEEAVSLYEQLKNSSEKHPYGEALLLKAQLDTDTAEAAAEGLKRLHETWPEDSRLALDLMLAYQKTGRTELLEQLADACLKRNPKLAAAAQFRAEAAAARGDYETALERLCSLLSEQAGNPAAVRELTDLRLEWNKAQEKQLREKCAASPQDAGLLYDLLFCLVTNGKAEEAGRLAEGLPEEQPDAFSYYNIKSVLAGIEKQFDKALTYSEKLLEAVDRLQPDGTEKTMRRIRRRNEIVLRAADFLFLTDRREEALRLAEQVLLTGDPDTEEFMHLIHIHLRSRQYEGATQLAEQLVQKERDSASARYIKAFACFKTGRDTDAFQAVNEALRLDGTELAFYILKLRILLRNSALEPAQELIAFLQQNGVENTPSLTYCRLWLFLLRKTPEKTEEEHDRMLAEAADASRSLEDGEDSGSDWIPHFYYIYALVTADRQEFSGQYPVEPLIELLDKGLAIDPDNSSCMSYKAWLLKKSGHSDEAAELYRKLAQNPKHGSDVDEALAELYYDRLEDCAEDALHYYRILLEKSPDNPDLHFYVGMCCFRLDRPAEAEAHFRRLQEYAPDQIDGYYRLAFALLKQNRLEEAAEQGKKTAALAREREGDTVRFWKPLINAYRRLGRTEEAIEAVKDCASFNPEWKLNDIIFEIFIQAGRYREAEKLLLKCRRTPALQNTMDWASKLALLYMLKRRFVQLRALLLFSERTVPVRSALKAKRLVSAASGRLRFFFFAAERAYETAKANETLSACEFTEYAWAAFVCGKTEKAAEAAAAGLKEAERQTKRASGLQRRYQCMQIRLLTVLGREADARAAAEAAARMPRCELCANGACLELAVNTCCLEYAFGSSDKAEDLARQGEKLFPDETVFIELQYLIRMSGGCSESLHPNKDKKG